ncbi:MAG TPA: putative inorganic carbon transporter subunit DabA, partial [Elusimicrobiota bacterium]|nr:putative inorganic carbon transporter subunit DabA [Elusimicrobiota bacterium]
MPVAGLDEILQHIGDLLPAQGPIGIFVHHNTLHAFESLDFEQAAISAGERLACEPFLAEDDYRREISRGRIGGRDIEWALADDLGPRASQTVAAGFTRLELRRRVAAFGIPAAEGVSLTWLLQETPALREWRADVPDDARRSRKGSVGVLWKACRAAVLKTSPAPPDIEPVPLVRHRDLLFAATGLDTDGWVHPTLIRLVGAFLDQGLSRWTLPDRPRGLYACFMDVYSHDWASLCGPWAGALPAELREER